MQKIALSFVAAAALVALSSTAMAQDKSSDAAPPSPGKSPVTPEPPTVAPASDPTNASAGTREGLSVTEPPRPAPQQYPAIGGHFGMAARILTVASDTTVIGKDFVNLGLTPGITLHLDDKWAIDFEFIAFNEFKSPAHSVTTFVVDPGIIRKFDGFVAGMRVATQVGAPTNSGIVPIFVVPFKVSQRAVYFVEIDVPLFLRDGGRKPEGSATLLLQTGFGF